MSFSGNPALDIWKSVMDGIDSALELPNKSFVSGTSTKSTGIFGSHLDDVKPTPSPTPTPEATETPAHTTDPTPVVTESPAAPEEPVEPAA